MYCSSESNTWLKCMQLFEEKKFLFINLHYKVYEMCSIPSLETSVHQYLHVSSE